MKRRILAVLTLALFVIAGAGMPLARASESHTVQIAAAVSVTGSRPDASEAYTVVLKALDSACPMPEGSANGVCALTLNGPGAGKFPAITFERLGVYAYEIYQLPGSHPAAASYDDARYALTVAVTRAEDGTDAQIALTRAGSTDKLERCDFINAYLDPADDDPPVRKVVTGDTPDAAATFTFTMTAEKNTANLAVAGMPMPQGAVNGVKTIRVRAGEEGEFGVLRFNLPGTYVYTVAEVDDGQTGYDYDHSPYTVTYVVAPKDSKLEAARTITRNGKTVDATGFEFRNTYTKTAEATAKPTTSATAKPAATPEPTLEVTGRKVWSDGGNVHHTRPSTVSLALYADGAAVPGARLTWLSRSGDEWTFSFGKQPALSADGSAIHYTVQEAPVPYYHSEVSGMTVTNTLEERRPTAYTEISGVKTWSGADGKRPAYITVHLLRDGVVVEQRAVTVLNDWQYSFGSQPADDGYGHTYAYTVREDAVPGYYARYSGYDVTNIPLGGGSDGAEGIAPNGPEIDGRETATFQPTFQAYSDEELENLLELFHYQTPLSSGLLPTGDEVPAWVVIAAVAGLLALLAFVWMGRKERKF